MKALENKKVLFFAPKFFGYEIEILKALRSYGASVDYFDERPMNSFITKASIRLNRNFVLKKLKNYYHNINVDVSHRDYDFILIVGLEAMLPSSLAEIKANHPNAVSILYMWDSLKNKKYAEHCLPLFDHIFSFDKGDVAKNNKINFRPLFFIEDYGRISEQVNSSIETDLCFIGTVHSDRYNFLKSIQNQASSFGLTFNFHMFMPSKKLFFYKKLSDAKFRKAKIKDLKFNSLSHKEIIEHVRKSKVILDVQHPSQTGLTMRTLEMLGACKKLITTNQDVKNYDFYNEDNVLVVDRNTPVLDEHFFKTPYKEVSGSIKYYYTINGWLESLFALYLP